MFKLKLRKIKKKGRKSLYNPKQKAELPSLEKLEISHYFRTRFIYTIWFYIHTSHTHTSLERENDAKRLDIITLDQEFDLLRGLV